MDAEVPFDLRRWILLRDPVGQEKGTRRVKRTGTRPRVVVTANGRGVVGRAGTRLLADLADATGLSTALGEALMPLRQRDSGHGPGRVALDVAVMLADGGEAIGDLAVLRNQPELFGPVASGPTAWRVLDGIDTAALTRLRTARARAREVAWAQAAETGRLTSSAVAGLTIPGLVLDLDATIVRCHSEKESAAKTWKRSFGYHPVRREAPLIRAEVRGLRRRPCRSRAVKLRTARTGRCRGWWEQS
jgi:hypothetical protein